MAVKIKIKNFSEIFQKIGKHHLFRKSILVLGIAVIFVAILFAIFNLIYNNRVLPHTFIGTTNFGGFSKAEAEDILKELVQTNQDASLSYSWQDKSYNLKLVDIDVNWQDQNSESIDRLMNVGRSGGVLKILKEQVRAIFKKNSVEAAFTYDGDRLDEFIKSIAADVDKPEKDASIEIKDNQPTIIPEEIGERFTFDLNRQIAISSIGSFNLSGQTPFLVEKVYPKVTTLGAQMALAETNALLGSHLILKAGEKTFHLYPTDIASMIDFVIAYGKKGVLGISSDQSDSAKEMVVAYSLFPEISQDKLNAFVDKIASEINQPAQDAKFEVSDGKVRTFQSAQTGYELDKEKSIALIQDSLKKGETVVELPVNVTEPIVNSDASTVGIKELVGEGKTSWRGSPPNRIHNLSLGAEKISGTLVQPGQEFSTLHALAPITAANGYLRELVIKNSNRVEPDIGGGLCQVSSTLFRAALSAGLQITARTAHSFRVSYYEPPVGIDATIFEPAPDLKFVNNYSTPILIWGSASNNSLVFQIYGTKDGRIVEISDPVVGNYTSPGEPIYTESDTVASGVIRQVERAVAGATASFHYKVTSASGEILQEETYVSKYVPVPNSYLYGPGTEGIPGQESPSSPGTSEPAPTPTPTPTSTSKK